MVQPPYPFRILPWNIYRGDDSQYPITDTASDDTPTDLTPLGDTWTCQIRRSGEGVPIDVAVDDTDAATGQLLLTLDGAVTLTLSQRGAGQPAPDYYCDIQVSGGPITPLTVYRMDVYLTPDVTQP